MAKKSRSLARERRHVRVRKVVVGTTSRPRLNVFKSITGIYAQIIDDMQGRTVLSASTVDKDLREKVKGMKKTEQAKKIGASYRITRAALDGDFSWPLYLLALIAVGGLLLEDRRQRHVQPGHQRWL